jgi:hypothetical protein
MSEQASLTPECRALIGAALDRLKAGADGHDAAMLHFNVTSIDDPGAVVDGYRGGTLASLDDAAHARGAPFRCTGPVFHQAVLAILSAHVEAGMPLYLLRVRFAQRAAVWHATSTTTQSIAARTQLLRDRSPLDARLRATLCATPGEWSVARLSRSRLPGNTAKIGCGVYSADRTYRQLEPPVDIADLMAEIEAFYRSRGFALDSLTARLERASDGFSVDDYYG